MVKRRIRSDGKVERERFWGGVQRWGGWLGEDIVMGVYYGLVKHILNELSERGYVDLPDFGRFRVYKWGGRVCRNFKGGDKILGDKKAVTFVSGEKLSKYVNERGKILDK